MVKKPRPAFSNRGGCIFCKIAQGKISCYKIYEDKDHIAFLDIFPNIKGQTLVVPKKHMRSYLFNTNMRSIDKLMLASKNTARILEKGLRACRIHLVVEGTGVNHLHAKLYPAIGTDSRKFRQILSKESTYFETYPGFVSTMMGPKASDKDLMRVYNSIKRVQKMAGQTRS
jgi:diadenosine tetraphosphate (Ap4A) HIT family hydrolase